MKTEKDIIKFMKDNRISVPKDDRFMSDLLKQIELLPVPASLDSNEKNRILENMRLVEIIRLTLKKYYRRQAITALLIDIVLCLVLFLATYILISPDMMSGSPVLEFLYSWRYLIAGSLSIGIIVFSITRTELSRM